MHNSAFIDSGYLPGGLTDIWSVPSDTVWLITVNVWSAGRFCWPQWTQMHTTSLITVNALSYLTEN